MRHFRRCLQQLCTRAECEPDNPCGCVCSGMSAAPGAADLRHKPASAEDPTGARQPKTRTEYRDLAFSPVLALLKLSLNCRIASRWRQGSCLQKVVVS